MMRPAWNVPRGGYSSLSLYAQTNSWLRRMAIRLKPAPIRWLLFGVILLLLTPMVILSFQDSEPDWDDELDPEAPFKVCLLVM